MSGDGGCAGGGRRRRRRRLGRQGAAEDESPAAAGERQRRRLQEALSELKDSDFWDSSRSEALPRPPQPGKRPGLGGGDSPPRRPFLGAAAGNAAGAGKTRFLPGRVKSLARPPPDPLHRAALGSILKSLGPPLTVERNALAALGELQEALPGESDPTGPVGRAGGLRCVCYGLGNFCSCGKARLQLAFLLLLLEELKIPPEMCFIFDPIFSTLETEVLGGLGLTVLQWNEEGKRSIEGPTLFYMIHCGKALYNNLLWSNWSVEALSQVVVIGNSFRGFEERLLAKVFRENYSYIAKVLEASQEEPLPPHPLHPDVFNDTSVHRFPLEKLRGLPQDCWACQPEPFYPEETQLEIIRNKPQ